MRGQEDNCICYDWLRIFEGVYIKNSSNSYLVIKGLDYNTDILIFSSTRVLRDATLSFMPFPESKSNIVNSHLILRTRYEICESDRSFQMQACRVVPFSCVSVTADDCLGYNI